MLQLAERVITAARKEAGPQAGGQIPSLHQVAREAELLAEAVTSKLRREPIEDLRLDFEDGFGDQGDEFEDQWVAQAARDAVAGQNETGRSEEHTSELQSRGHLVCRLLLEKKKRKRCQ